MVAVSAYWVGADRQGEGEEGIQVGVRGLCGVLGS